AAVVEIAAHREMGKQPALLKYAAYTAAMRRQVDARSGIEQHGAVERHAAAAGRDQAGAENDDRRLAGPRTTEQRGHALGGLELGGQQKIAQAFFDVEGKHAHSPWKRMPARRANHSDAISAASASAIATSTRRPAAASPPGT